MPRPRRPARPEPHGQAPDRAVCRAPVRRLPAILVQTDSVRPTMFTHDTELGFGLGLRTEHYAEIFDGKPAVDWFEAVTENYLVAGGRPLHNLMRVRERFPVALHGVSLSIGSTGPLDLSYLAQVKALAKRVDPVWISDHLCWTGVNGKNLHDLLPLPYTEEALAHVVARVRAVQEILVSASCWKMSPAISRFRNRA